MKLSYLIAKLIKKLHIPAVINSKVDKTSKVSSSSHIVDSRIDKYSYVGNNCTVINTQIGKYCSIADNCIIGGANHPIDWASTSPVFHNGKNILRKNFSKHHFKTSEITQIGNDVWLGNNSLIKTGVKIGDGSIIGMGSVLTKDVGEFEIWAGNPAKFIRRRFDKQIANEIAQSQWWEFDEKKLEEVAVNFNDLEMFLKGIRENQ